MHSSTYLVALFGLLISVTSAVPASILRRDPLAPASITILAGATAPEAAAAAVPAAASPSKSPAPTANGTSSTSSPNAGTACAPAVNSLALGIEANIADQNNELTTVTALGNVLAQNPMDMTLYAATQTSLLGFVTKGITIRENNQKIAPSGNAALPGLAVVAMAQMAELNLTMSLAVPSTGIVDQATANKTVEVLKGDFSGGIKKNMENLKMATGGCTVTGNSSTAAAGGKPTEEGAKPAEPMPEMMAEMGMK